ncbi:MAG: discoidin domain-containing protein [Thiobacillus sp.]|nr:discoidin domain-containing protein [Thiobacillus sp.]
MTRHTLPALLALLLPASIAHALELTDLPGATASASACYQGCGNARYDASNIIDDDYGLTGNTGFNAWNSGTYAGWVQVDFGAAYVLDRIDLYAWQNTNEPFTLSASVNGTNWTPLAVSGYHAEPNLLHTGGSGTAARADDWGAVFDVANGSLASGVSARYVRYTVNAGSPHWGYLFELDVQGHVATVPEAHTGALMLAGLGLVGFAVRRRKAL